MTTQPYVMTDDPADPCAYCVQWEEQPDDTWGDNAIPYAAPGVPVTRLYRYIHTDCEAAVAAYVAETEA